MNFIHINSTAVPLPEENIDTDQIIPARFLKATTREGFGDNLFRDWRFEADGTPKKDFILNDPKYKGEILVAGRNFGCGSSREHAAWALVDYGFRVIISSFFADIFRSNALNNFLLPLQVSEVELQTIFVMIQNDSNAIFSVDLEKQTFSGPSGSGIDVHFEISPYKKMCLMNGYDNIEYLLSMKDHVVEYEMRRVL